MAGTVTCTCPSLAVGAAPDITIVVTPITAGLITNNATVSGSSSDSNPANNTATATTRVCPAIALAPATLPDGILGTAYSQTVTASPGGTYSYAVTSGSLLRGSAWMRPRSDYRHADGNRDEQFHHNGDGLWTLHGISGVLGDHCLSHHSAPAFPSADPDGFSVQPDGGGQPCGDLHLRGDLWKPAAEPDP